MLKSIVSIDEFRTNLAELIGRVMYGQDRIIIKKYNRDAAVLLSVEEYERLVDPSKRFSKKEWESRFTLMNKIKERIPETDQKTLDLEIANAVREVRIAKKNGV